VLVDRHLVEIVARSDVQRLFLASSCEVYGSTGRGRPIAESTRFAPRSPYAVSKVAMEHLARIYTRPSLHTTALRFFNVYGADEGRDAVVPRFVAELRETGGLTIEGSGSQRRDFTYIDDLVDMLVDLLLRTGTPPHVVNVGSGRSVSIRSVAQTMLALAGGGEIRRAPERPKEIADFVADTRRLARMVTLRRRTLANGLRCCWDQTPAAGIDVQSRSA
jgi:dTDP-glucose 4,6-dehydratase/UDP-glucose 4-epimerase